MAERAQVPLNRTEVPIEAPTDLYNANFPNLPRPSRPNSRRGTLNGAPCPPLVQQTSFAQHQNQQRSHSMMAERAQVPLNRTEGPLGGLTDQYNAHFPNLPRPSRPNSRQGPLDGAPCPPPAQQRATMPAEDPVAQIRAEVHRELEFMRSQMNFYREQWVAGQQASEDERSQGGCQGAMGGRDGEKTQHHTNEKILAMKLAKKVRPQKKFSKGDSLEFTNIMAKFDLATNNPALDARTKLMEMEHYFEGAPSKIISAYMAQEDADKAYAKARSELEFIHGQLSSMANYSLA